MKNKSESSKKSPTKEKKEEKVKEDKPKPKERLELKPVKKEAKDAGDAKKGKKNKSAEVEKPADFDEGVWEEVPKKSEKKKVEGKKKAPEEKEKEKKKESPVKKNKKVVKDADVEAARPNDEPIEETVKVSVGPEVDEESARALQAQVEEFQRVLKEVIHDCIVTFECYSITGNLLLFL